MMGKLDMLMDAMVKQLALFLLLLLIMLLMHLLLLMMLVLVPLLMVLLEDLELVLRRALALYPVVGLKQLLKRLLNHFKGHNRLLNLNQPNLLLLKLLILMMVLVLLTLVLVLVVDLELSNMLL